MAAQGAFSNGQGAGQAPLRDSSSLSSESTHQSEVARWLGAVKAAGTFRGWEYLPITDGDGSSGTRYGVLFFKHEAQAKILSSGAVAGDGVVLESDNNGISPLLEGAQLPSLADWAAGHAITVTGSRATGARTCSTAAGRTSSARPTSATRTRHRKFDNLQTEISILTAVVIFTGGFTWLF